eukprot:14010387-Alexandrium_andersonii.AAC.1
MVSPYQPRPPGLRRPLQSCFLFLPPRPPPPPLPPVSVLPLGEAGWGAEAASLGFASRPP